LQSAAGELALHRIRAQFLRVERLAAAKLDRLKSGRFQIFEQ